MKEENVDSRVRRTKRLLRQGLTELLKEKSIKKILQAKFLLHSQTKTSYLT